MEKIKEISSQIHDEIERKLFCIKSYNYIFDKEFEKTFNFKFIIYFPYHNSDNNNIVTIDDKTFIIENQSRIIDFIIQESK